jgi:predicted CoA-binding protein
MPSILELPFPDKTAISVITPPAVTLKVLQDAKQLGIKHIWIQPGGEDEKVIDFAKANPDLGILLGGPCILVEGPGLLQSRGRL